MKKIKHIISVVFLLSVPSLVIAHEGGYGMWPGMMGWGHSRSWAMMIIMFIFWATVIAGLISLTRMAFSKGNQHESTKPIESALNILKKRYAKGEINKHEFDEKKKVIGQ